MKSVLISIQPKWCGLIASGKKTVEVRKTKPKTNVPFKCYIYETKAVNKNKIIVDLDGDLPTVYARGKGQVIGEFVCDSITGGYWIAPFSDYLQSQSCLSYDEVCGYANGKPIFAWHISNLKIYDKPKELGEFRKPCIDKEHYCPLCPLSTELLADVTEVNEYGHTCLHRVKRPPQSWCYVEGLGEYGQ